MSRGGASSCNKKLFHDDIDVGENDNTQKGTQENAQQTRNKLSKCEPMFLLNFMKTILVLGNKAL